MDSLPTQTAAAPDLWTERLSLVGAVPEADISLYLLNLARPGVLLRQGGEFSYFPLERQFQDLPLLVWRDFDGDGSEELLLLCYDRPQAAQLYLCRWADGWTVHAFFLRGV